MQRVKAAEDTLHAFKETVTTKFEIVNRDYHKQNKYMMEAQDALQSVVNDNHTSERKAIQSNTDTMKII